MKGLFGKYKVLLAPMAGVSDVAFRTVCREMGADLTFTEMVSAKGLSYANQKTRDLLDLADGENYVGVQLFGHEPETMASQAAWVEDTLKDSLAYIDVNMGCPARKIVSKGDGSALMNDSALAAEIITAIKRVVSCGVTAKFRRGWRIGEETCVDFAKQLEQAGVDAVTVHGRFAEQLYHGQADWSAISRVKTAVEIPVVGNGDIKCGHDAVALSQQTNCDAVMIARGAQGNPWIFEQAQAAIAGKAIPDSPSISERLNIARKHARLLAERDGRNLARMRKHAMWYVSGLPGATKARGLLSTCSTLEEFDAVFDELEERATNPHS